MDKLTCLGCGKAFNSQRHLSAHETLCDTHHEFSKQVSKSHQHVEKSQNRKKSTTTMTTKKSWTKLTKELEFQVPMKTWVILRLTSGMFQYVFGIYAVLD
jgi:hypothetical protein